MSCLRLDWLVYSCHLNNPHVMILVSNIEMFVGQNPAEHEQNSCERISIRLVLNFDGMLGSHNMVIHS